MEAPLSVYVGFVVQAKTRKRKLVEKLSRLGLSISYSRVDDIQTSITKQLCNQYALQDLAKPPSIKDNVFTTFAIDNIDHNVNLIHQVNIFMEIQSWNCYNVVITVFKRLSNGECCLSMYFRNVQRHTVMLINVDASYLPTFPHANIL